jgi:rubrerythrin
MENLTLHKIVRLAVSTEQVGERFYTRLAKRFADNADVAAVFARLAKDETAHAAYFETLLSKAPATNEDLTGFEVGDYLRATAVGQFFKQEELENIETIKTAEDALFAAANLERQTLMFYQALAETLDKNDPVMQDIINEEKEHLTAVMKVLMTGAKFRTLSDKWA